MTNLDMNYESTSVESIQQQQQQQQQEIGGGGGGADVVNNVSGDGIYNNNSPSSPFPRSYYLSTHGFNSSSSSSSGGAGAVRFPAWVALSMLSILSFVSMITRNYNVETATYKYAISVATLSSIFSILSVLGYLFYRPIYMSQPQHTEIALSSIVLILWSSGLPIIMNPSNGLAVSVTQVVNANLYFASWGCFIIILWICFNIFQEINNKSGGGIDDDVISRTTTIIIKTKQGHWYALIASSVVVLSASVRIFIADDCSIEAMKYVPICKQTKFAIASSIIATIVSSSVTLLFGCTNLTTTTSVSTNSSSKGCCCLASSSSSSLHYLELIGSILMFIIWIFGMIFITFGEGPGHSIGNLYFATWGCFLLSILIMSECYQEYIIGSKQHQHQEQQAATAATAVATSAVVMTTEEEEEDLQLEQEMPPPPSSTTTTTETENDGNVVAKNFV